MSNLDDFTDFDPDDDGDEDDGADAGPTEGAEAGTTDGTGEGADTGAGTADGARTGTAEEGATESSEAAAVESGPDARSSVDDGGADDDADSGEEGESVPARFVADVEATSPPTVAGDALFVGTTEGVLAIGRREVD